MASDDIKIKIHEQCNVAPPSATQTSLPLTFFDIIWLVFHPVERIFFYSLPLPQSHPSFFFAQVVPKLKTSLSLTLQHFLPLAGYIIWPSDSPMPIIQYTPGDAVSVVVAESHADFNHVIDCSPHDASLSRSFVPHLNSSDSHASVISIQITLFPNKGFSIGMSIHHAVLDGKSSILFTKAWAFLCQTNDETPSPCLVPELKPLFDRTNIQEPTHLRDGIQSRINSYGRCLRIPPSAARLEDTVRATFLLTRGDLEKIKKRVLSKWDVVEESEPKPPTLSSFVLTCAHALVCMAKAIHQVKREKDKFTFAFTVDCRARLEPPIPNNYCGNCVWGLFVDTDPRNFIKEEGLIIVAKSIHSKVKMLTEKGVFHVSSPNKALLEEGVEILGIAGSNRFGVYETDFGWGKPSKVEITSVDRGFAIGLAESKDGSGGVQVGLVLNKHEMDLFGTLFHAGLRDD